MSTRITIALATSLILSASPFVLRAGEPESPLETKVYPVMDQIMPDDGPRPREEELIRLIQRTIAENTWTDRHSNGRGQMEYYRRTRSLIVTQTHEVQEQVADFLEQLAKSAKPQGDQEVSEPQSRQPSKLEKLLEKYEKACGSGDMAKARKLANKALTIDPTCFRQDREQSRQQTRHTAQPHSTDPNERMDALLTNSEKYKALQGEWKRFWFVDQPSHMTSERIHGGIE
jgi:hypothetical protein